MKPVESGGKKMPDQLLVPDPQIQRFTTSIILCGDVEIELTGASEIFGQGFDIAPPGGGAAHQRGFHDNRNSDGPQPAYVSNRALEGSWNGGHGIVQGRVRRVDAATHGARAELVKQFDGFLVEKRQIADDAEKKAPAAEKPEQGFGILAKSSSPPVNCRENPPRYSNSSTKERRELMESSGPSRCEGQ